MPKSDEESSSSDSSKELESEKSSSPESESEESESESESESEESETESTESSGSEESKKSKDKDIPLSTSMITESGDDEKDDADEKKDEKDKESEESESEEEESEKILEKDSDEEEGDDDKGSSTFSKRPMSATDKASTKDDGSKKEGVKSRRGTAFSFRSSIGSRSRRGSFFRANVPGGKGRNALGLGASNAPIPTVINQTLVPTGAKSLVNAVKNTTRQQKLQDTMDIKYFPVILHDGSANHRTFAFPSNTTKTTKYTPFNFIFKFLFEQYKKATNIFFLFAMVITLIPGVTPVSPITSILPVIFVLTVSAIREIAEDVMRFKADKKTNNEEFFVSQDGRKFKNVKSMDIHVGDVIKLSKNQRVPADCVLIKTSLPDGLCYVETSQLDGETNLKSFHAPGHTSEMSERKILNMRGTLISEKPNHHLKSYHGRLIIDEFDHKKGEKKRVIVPLSDTALLLQGASIRNTEYAYCIVAFTGLHTKLSLNQRKPPSKFSTSDKILNRYVYSMFVVIFVLVIIAAGLAYHYYSEAQDDWYLFGTADRKRDSKLMYAGKNLLSYFFVCSYLLPMSMVVTLEICRFIQAIMMTMDKKLIHPIENIDGTVTEEGLVAKTSNLNDELSLVRYIFSDKTGTLTENKMVFNQCTVDGVKYLDPMNGELLSKIQDENGNLDISTPHQKYLEEFLICLGLCNSIVPNRGKDGKMEYVTQSPDETALAQASEANSFVFVERTQKYVVLEYPGNKMVRFNIVADIEFSSDRRRMSVILRKSDGTVVLYTKGADNVMLPLLSENQHKPDAVNVVKENLAEYSQKGLRALVLAERVIPEDVLAKWMSKYDEVSSMLGDREKAMKDLFAELETDMTLLGCTAVEDKLQEGVPDAIHNLLLAGIQVWMITGDKQETAINISKSCRLVSPDATLFIADNLTEENCERVLSKLSSAAYELKMQIGSINDEGEIELEPGSTALVINGASTHIAVNQHPELFMKLVSNVSAVVCCQVTPLQKAQVVQCVKSQTTDICLSIGDGANDVSMIQTAHIGVGIFGREGTQAARASDFAIRQFRDVQRLITIHGRYSILRSSKCVKLSFFKNMAFIFVQYIYGFFNLFSARTIYSDWVITFFNTFATALPPLMICLFEKDVSADLIEKYPQLNKPMLKCPYFRVRDIFYWLLYGFYCTLVFVFVPHSIIQAGDHSSGILGAAEYTTDFTLTSAYATFHGVLTCHIIPLMYTSNFTKLNTFGIAFGIVFYIIQWIVENFGSPAASSLAGTLKPALSQPIFYIVTILSIIASITPYLLFRYIQARFFPDPIQLFREYECIEEKKEKSREKSQIKNKEVEMSSL